jgi:hypothetical protein
MMVPFYKRDYSLQVRTSPGKQSLSYISTINHEGEDRGGNNTSMIDSGQSLKLARIKKNLSRNRLCAYGGGS